MLAFSLLTGCANNDALNTQIWLDNCAALVGEQNVQQPKGIGQVWDRLYFYWK